jgi:orotate phosphoribosyltransferase
MKNIDEIISEAGGQLADIALELGAIKLQPNNPFTWASGYRMPIYNDNRRLLASFEARELIANTFAKMVEALQEDFDNIAGTSTAGIPHATTLADKLKKPLSYVRSSSKDHGTGQKIEGLGDSHSYEGAKVLLIEDLISTGGSSINAVKAIVNEGGVCPYTFAIFTYGLQQSVDAFDSLDPKCKFFTILNYDVMVKRALEIGYVDKESALTLTEWRQDPFNWGENNGYSKVER